MLQGQGVPFTTGLRAQRSQPQLATAAWLALAVAVALALGTFHIGRASLWSDEVFSRYYYDLFGLHFLLTDGLRLEPTPPTHAILLHLWIVLFGDSEAALRSLSAIAYAACMPVVFLLARSVAGRREALLATLLLALCPMGLYFAQEARTYALTLAPAAALLLASAGFLADQRPRWASVAYVASGTICLYLHATLVFLIASCAITVAACLLLSSRQRLLAPWIALNAAVAALGAPYLWHLAAASQSGGLDWIGPLRMRDVVAAVAAVTDGIITPFPWPGAPMAALFTAVLTVSVLLARPPARTAAILIGVPCLFLTLVTAISLVRPILLPRVLCWTIIPVCILAARQMLTGGWFRYAVMAATVASFGMGLFAWEAAPNAGKEPWRDMLTTLAPDLRQAGLVVLSPRFDPMILKYYAPGVRHLKMWDERLPPTIMTAAAERLGMPQITRQEIAEAVAGGVDVWVLSNIVDMATLEAFAANTPARQVHTWRCGTQICMEAMEFGPATVNLAHALPAGR